MWVCDHLLHRFGVGTTQKGFGTISRICSDSPHEAMVYPFSTRCLTRCVSGGGSSRRALEKGLSPLERSSRRKDHSFRPFLSAYATSNDYVYISVFVVYIRMRQWFTVFGPGEQTLFWAPLNTDHAL